MVALITDPYLERRLIRRRRAWGADRYDEVWDGVYVMDAMPDIEHQTLVGRLTYILMFLVDDQKQGLVLPGCNVSDRAQKWRQNYRVPDVAVFLNETRAVNKISHWLGGPDLAIEIVSPQDRSREKLDFYSQVKTRELLLIDRNPWSMELYRWSDAGRMESVGRTTLQDSQLLTTTAIPLQWQLLPGTDRPIIEAAVPDGSRRWQV